MNNHAFGLDIGGTGMKGAVVDLDTGEVVSERVRLDTPQPATIAALLDAAAAVVTEAGWEGPLGCTFPGIVKHGIIGSSANLAPEWVGEHLGERLSAHLGLPVTPVNDADAAGLAEMRFGAGRGTSGVVLMLTLGTGVGSAMFIDGVLVPNTELGHLEFEGAVAETLTSAAARERGGLGYEQWAERLERYFTHLERLFSPDLFIIGGGISRKAERFLPLIDIKTPMVPAESRHNAGIVGAALACAEATPTFA